MGFSLGGLISNRAGNAPFNPDDYYLRVDKNVYGRQESGLIWFKELDQYLRGTLGFTTMPIDRCLFRLTSASGEYVGNYS